MRVALAILAVCLFCLNYQICELVYSDNIDKWWGLKQNIYNVIIAICFYLSKNKTQGLLKFVLDVGMGFCVSNCIDRIVFDVTTFTHEDVFMIVLTILISYYDAYYAAKRSTGIEK